MRCKQLINIVLCSAALSCSCGCTFSGWKASMVSLTSVAGEPADVSAVRDQERRFAGALEFLRSGRESEARDLLEQVVSGPPRNGVSDEALFRLSLLYLRDDNGKGTAARTQELLDRLTDEFPASIWTYQGAPLSSYLTGIRMLRDRQREVRTLKELNYSLSRDNREMRQSLERLKSLDLELEKKIKR